MVNVILQSLGLDLVSIDVYANVYQNIPNGLRVVRISFFFFAVREVIHLNLSPGYMESPRTD